jgi:hypothetical protein
VKNKDFTTKQQQRVIYRPFLAKTQGVGEVIRGHSSHRMLLRNRKVAMAASTPTNQPMIPQLSGSTDNAPDGELELWIFGSQGSRSPSPPVSQLMYDLQPSTNNAPDGQISSPKSPGHQEPHIT